ncbi:hypothetical protein ACFLS0_07895, partial [Candidatus Bipolaricaulota bacterium]
RRAQSRGCGCDDPPCGGLTLGPVGRAYHTVKTTWTDSAGQAGRRVNTGSPEDRYRNGGVEPGGLYVERVRLLPRGELRPHVPHCTVRMPYWNLASSHYALDPGQGEGGRASSWPES